MNKLANKTAIVTGAAAGLGRAIALLYAEHGCKLIATDINNEGLETLAEAITKSGGHIKTVVADMANDADIEHMLQVTTDTYGALDILVNNAGIMDNFSPIGDVADDMWERVMNVNVTGPMKAMRGAIKLMLSKGSGVIVNIASVGGISGAKAGAAYTASKHALIGLSKNTGYMYAKSGIRCNAIAAGAMNTNIAAGIDMQHLPPLVMERMMPGMALMPRTSEPSEVANVALFLASDDSSFINGAVIAADGGWTAY